MLRDDQKYNLQIKRGNNVIEFTIFSGHLKDFLEQISDNDCEFASFVAETNSADYFKNQVNFFRKEDVAHFSFSEVADDVTH